MEQEGNSVESNLEKSKTTSSDSKEGCDPPRAACNYCGEDYAADRHNNDFAKSETENDIAFGKMKKLDIEGIRKSLAKMVLLDELPFKMVEGEGFRAYSQVLEPRFVVSSRITVARDCMKLYVEEKKALKKLLKSQRVCLTTDTWTSIQNLNYMCLTAHWIDDSWKLQKRILNFLVLRITKEPQ
ncbi:UNVERIFIED_CONTAM: putative AC transposase [Sesamum latifolium]|uniref:AC transposase n=1 Tax=Sesamum latifolium TaxID=2727402 RepID=A0AAW2Y0R2_9LAMI